MTIDGVDQIGLERDSKTVLIALRRREMIECEVDRLFSSETIYCGIGGGKHLKTQQQQQWRNSKCNRVNRSQVDKQIAESKSLGKPLVTS